MHLHEEDDRKFIVYASCLRLLLMVCSICSCPCRVSIKYIRGTAVTLQAICTRNHTRTWSSQPLHKAVPTGNICLASSLFFWGSSPIKAINMLRFTKIARVRTYELIQTSYLIPASKQYLREATILIIQ